MEGRLKAKIGLITAVLFFSFLFLACERRSKPIGGVAGERSEGERGLKIASVSRDVHVDEVVSRGPIKLNGQKLFSNNCFGLSSA